MNNKILHVPASGIDTEIVPVRGRVVKSKWARNLLTFLMVFVIQNTQNRDTKAIHLKLDELIRVNRAARNSLMSLEEQSESEVEEIKSDFVGLAATENPPPRE